MALKRLLLAGGGHAHLAVLERLARERPEGVEGIMVTPQRRQIYSGALPGWLAGHYRLEECIIPLLPLTSRAGIHLLEGEVVGWNASARQVCLRDGRTLSYDAASIAIGSITRPLRVGRPTPDPRAILPVRPIEGLVARLPALIEALRGSPRHRLALVGGGAASLELVLALAHRLGGGCQLTLITDAARLLPEHPARVGVAVEAALARFDIGLRASAQVGTVTRGGVQLATGEIIPADSVLVATGAAPAHWLRDSGLALDPVSGFLQVGTDLAVPGAEGVFAAGDSASVAGHPRPRAGVFAVRQGPLLAENILRYLRGMQLVHARPQALALYLIATGPRHAVMSWGPIGLQGEWAWRWKDRIDRRFLRRHRPEGAPPAG